MRETEAIKSIGRNSLGKILYIHAATPVIHYGVF